MFYPNPIVHKNRERHAMQDILFEERNIFINSIFEEDMALAVCQQMMVLDNMNKTKDITIYINSPGGQVTSALSIIDVMRTIKCPVSTIALGGAASAAALTLAAGTKGKRRAMLHSRIMIHEVAGGQEGKFKDLRASFEEIMKTDRMLNELLASFCSKSVDEIEKVIRLDHYMSAAEAKDFGLIDEVIQWKI